MPKNALLAGTPWKGMLSFTLPIFLGLLLQQCYHTADTIIVGNFSGETALAAVGACGVLIMAFLAIAAGFSAGACVLISQLFGAGNTDDMRRLALSALLAMLAMGTAASVTGVLISPYALRYVLATPENLMPMADTYFTVYSLGIVFQFGYNIVAAILRGIGDSKATLYFLLIASVVNIALALVFVCVFRLGVVGAAAATDIAQAVSCAAACIYMTKKYPLFRWKPAEFVPHRKLTAMTLRQGFPMALQQLSVSAGFVFLQRAVNSYGEAMTASFAAAQKIEVLMTLPAAALMIMQGTYTGQNAGAGNWARIITGAKHTIVMSLLVGFIAAAAAFLFADLITASFALGREAAEYCTAHIQCIAVCLLLFAGYFPILGLFQGINHALYSTFIASNALAVRVISTYALQNIPAAGYRMIWWNMLFGWGVGFIITWMYFFKCSFLNKQRS